MKRKAIPASLKWRLVLRQRFRCAICKQPLDDTLDIDHLRALHKGGSDSLENLQAVCLPCHRRKTRAELASRHRDALRCNGCGAHFSKFFVAQHQHCL